MIVKIGDSKQLVSGTVIIVSKLVVGNSWLVITRVFAPRVITSWTLLIVFSIKFLSVIILTTVIPFSIKAIGPCFNSPAA